MKQKRLSKGIITLVFFLTLGLATMLSHSATAYANSNVPKLNVKSKAIVKGKDYALKVYNLSETQTVTYTSKSPKIASVDDEGTVSALSVGTTVVTAVIEDSESDEVVKLQCKITVGPPALFIMLSQQATELTVGQRSIMYWLIAPLNTVERPKFSSSNPEVASVSASGVVTAKSEGTAYIFAQLDNGIFSACHVTVNAEVEVIEEEAPSEPAETTFEDFLVNLNSKFTDGDNTSENTDAEESAQ